MRHTVKKPRQATQPLTMAAGNQPRKVIGVDPHKLQKARQIKRSHFISKFGSGVTVVKTTATILPVQPEPNFDSPPPAASFKQAPSATSFDVKPPTKSDFEKAMHRASAHHEPYKNKPGKRERVAKRINVSTRIINITAVSLSVLLLFSIIAWQNVPSLSMKLASAKAGVKASLPEYAPAGFSLEGPIIYQQGQITLNYTSNSDNRSYQIIQVSSEMDDEKLRNNYLSKLNYGYTALEAEDRTIYLYDDYKATWLSDGVWYRLGGDFPFSNEQIENLVDNM